MKKVKSFNVGDKVFAKVKGYPAWPAKITGANGKKYDVTFYGTGERGSIKVEDLFYYIKHKEQYCKHLKRKDYNDAIEQIEAEIEASGTDGSSGNDVDEITTRLSDSNDKKGKKRKKSEDSADKFQLVDDGSATKKLVKKNNSDIHSQGLENNTDIGNVEELSGTPDSVKNDDLKNLSALTSRSGRIIKLKKFSDDEDDDSEKKGVKRRKSFPHEAKDEEDSDKKTAKRKSLAIQVKQEENDSTINLLTSVVKGNDLTPQTENDNETIQELKDVDEIKKEDNVEEAKIDVEIKTEEIESQESNDSEEEAPDVNIITVDYLKAVAAYAEYVKSKSSLFQGKKVEEPDCLENEVVIAKRPSGKLVGIKYNANRKRKFDSEYARAISDELEANTVLSLKEVIENGSCKPEDDISMFVMNIKIDEPEMTERQTSKFVERHQNKLNWLKAESNLIDLDCKIKSCLGLDKAEPKKALEYLESMMELNVEPLMLKKHPHIFDMVKRLRRYIGNVKEWNLTGDSLDVFESDAEKIRLKAGEVFAKFKALFKVPADVSFWDAFSTEVEKFKNDTKDFKESEIFSLHTEPDSRKTFFELYEKRKEIETTESNVNEKENSSEVANTEQSTETLEMSNSKVSGMST